ncbi:hypothetical protein [Alteromonas sp. AMM-1]|uniref:hypothetical protein n=1 Tax=Alteromonas sp. AMM-1 TaxID=3394233 RepID=UPI0039A4C812
MSKKKQQYNLHPSQDPALKSLLTRLGPDIANSFNTEQLMALSRVVGLRGGRIHSIDIRTTMQVPFLPWSFYWVFLVGKNRRQLTPKEKAIAVGMLVLCVTCFLMVCVALALVVLYILKSWFGINLIENYSLGLWDWLQASLHSLLPVREFFVSWNH